MGNGENLRGSEDVRPLLENHLYCSWSVILLWPFISHFYHPLRQLSQNFLALRTGFMEAIFPQTRGGERFWGDSSTLHLLCLCWYDWQEAELKLSYQPWGVTVNIDEALFTCRFTPSASWMFLTSYGLVPVHDQGVGDPCFKALVLDLGSWTYMWNFRGLPNPKKCVQDWYNANLRTFQWEEFTALTESWKDHDWKSLRQFIRKLMHPTVAIWTFVWLYEKV